MKIFQVIIFSILLFPMTDLVYSKDVPDSSFSVQLIKDIIYIPGQTTEIDQHKLDIYKPVGVGPFPVLMWIHGGAWVLGHRSNESELARRFAEQGIAVVVIDHRMSKGLWISPNLDKGVEHPAHIEDCAAAFTWIYSNCDSNSWDKDRLYVGGFSSGAHLAALLSMNNQYLQSEGLVLKNIRGSIAIGGTYDLESYYQDHLTENGKKMADEHILDVFGRDDGSLKDASPMSYLAHSHVEMLVISEKDTYNYTSIFEKAVKEANLSHIKFAHYQNRNHQNICILISGLEDDETRTQIINFIDKSESKE